MRDACQLVLSEREIVPPIIGQILMFQEEEEIGDSFERVVDLVRDAGGHPASQRKFICVAKGLFCAPGCGDVASYLGGADDSTF